MSFKAAAAVMINFVNMFVCFSLTSPEAEYGACRDSRIGKRTAKQGRPLNSFLGPVDFLRRVFLEGMGLESARLERPRFRKNLASPGGQKAVAELRLSLKFVRVPTGRIAAGRDPSEQETCLRTTEGSGSNSYITDGGWASLYGLFSTFGLSTTLWLSSFRGRAVRLNVPRLFESGTFCFA